MSKKKIQPIVANVKNSDIIRQVEGFSTRFNVPLDFADMESFKNRCINAMKDCLKGSDHKVEIDLISRNIFNLLGNQHFEASPSYSFESTFLYSFLCDNIEIDDNKTVYIWLMIVEVVLNTVKKKKALAKSIAAALRLSGVNAVLCNTPDGYLFYPANAELLDIKLVVDVLNWLNDYPKAKAQYDSALRMFLKGDRTRHILDTTRLALELFLKQFFVNEASLEKQTGNIGDYLKAHGISAEIRNMFQKLLDYYAKYNNEHVKHDDSISENEIEFVIYLTGTFIRFIINTKKQSEVVSK